MISAKGGAVLLWNRTDTITIKQLVVESRRNSRCTTARRKVAERVIPRRGGKEMATSEVIQWAITAFLAAQVAYCLIVRIIKRK